jgi:lipoprotein-anchoring transpeptidase ErfK/SrfK
MATPETPRSRSARRTITGGPLRRRAVALAGALVVVAGGTAFALSGGHSATLRATVIHAKIAPAPKKDFSTPPATIATTKVPQLQAFTDPNASSKLVASLSAKTDYNLPRTVLVVQSQPGWLQALLPMRPNGTMGWIRASDVTLSTTTYEIDVSVSKHTLILKNAGQVVLYTTVAVGKQQTPTPIGKFFVTDPIDLQSHPNGTYGAYALGLSGYSDVLKSFDGGPGQIAIHGWLNQSDFGKDASNGCVRIPNPVVVQVAKAVPIGTPVVITA